MNDLSLLQQFAPQSDKPLTNGKNAVIYTRVSSLEQEDNTSLGSQKKHCENYAMKKDLNIVGYFGGTYESAKTDDRKEFNRMLNFVKRSKNISYVIVYSYERFSRSGINGASIADDLLKQYGVVTLAVSQELDPTTPSGSFQQKILFLFSQMDNEMRRDKSVAGMKEMLLKGYWIWEVPRGYVDLQKGGRASERQLVISEEGKILKKAFEWKAYKKMSSADIARKLNKMGVKIDERRLNNLFSNPFYTGAIVSKMLPDRVIQGHHEPMVPVELFLLVNGIRKEARSLPYTKDPDKENLPLKVFTKCEKCNTNLTGYIVKKKNLYYYKCRTKGCKTNRSAKVMHQMFLNMLNSFYVEEKHVNLLKDMLEEQIQNFFDQKLDQKKYLKINLAEVKKKIEKVEERFAVGEIEKTFYEKFVKKFRKEQAQIRKELSQTTLESSNLKKVIEYTLEICRNTGALWKDANIYSKRILQEMVYPEGISYDRGTDKVRTFRVNTFFALIPELIRLLKGKEKGDLINFNQVPQVGWKTGLFYCLIEFS